MEFAVPERYANDVKTGAGLDFTLEGKLNTFHATVYARESKIDPTTHTLTIRALYPNANGAVLPGRYASIKLNKDEIQDAPCRTVRSHCTGNGKRQDIPL